MPDNVLTSAQDVATAYALWWSDRSDLSDPLAVEYLKAFNEWLDGYVRQGQVNALRGAASGILAAIEEATDLDPNILRGLTSGGKIVHQIADRIERGDV